MLIPINHSSDIPLSLLTSNYSYLELSISFIHGRNEERKSVPSLNSEIVFRPSEPFFQIPSQQVNYFISSSMFISNLQPI
jgi:hypothetical protein